MSFLMDSPRAAIGHEEVAIPTVAKVAQRIACASQQVLPTGLSSFHFLQSLFRTD